jgi:hypothetical protein
VVGLQLYSQICLKFPKCVPFSVLTNSHPKVIGQLTKGRSSVYHKTVTRTIICPLLHTEGI